MALRKRDKAILKDLDLFRVMDRDSIAELHFSNIKRPILAANSVLLRLVRDGHIQRSTDFQPYVYMPIDSQMKKSSQKIHHYLALLETYKEIKRTVPTIQEFLIEPRYGGKGSVEPDIFLKFRNTGFFIEVQRTVYSEKLMDEKMDRYVSLFHANEFEVFPHVLIISNTHYKIDKLPFRVFQANSFTSFLQSITKQNTTTPPSQPTPNSNTVRTVIKADI